VGPDALDDHRHRRGLRPAAPARRRGARATTGAAPRPDNGRRRSASNPTRFVWLLSPRGARTSMSSVATPTTRG
jgi:hypothetical protein